MNKIRDIDPSEIYNKLKSKKKKNAIKFKNRRHLCEFLNVQYTAGGASRAAEDNYLSNIFNSRKKNNCIYITEIYDDYKERISQNASKFSYKEREVFTEKYGDKAYGIGIYGIYVNGELIYIGSSLNMDNRIREHCRLIYSEKDYPNDKYEYLHKCILDGKTISFEIIDDTITEENRYGVEYEYIEKYKPKFNVIGVIRAAPVFLSKKQLIEKYKEQIEKYQNKINVLQEKINQLNETK